MRWTWISAFLLMAALSAFAATDIEKLQLYNAKTGAEYEVVLGISTSQGVSPPSYKIADPAKAPKELTLDEQFPRLHGKPTTAGTYTFVVEVFDGSGKKIGQAECILVVGDKPPMITSASTAASKPPAEFKPIVTTPVAEGDEAVAVVATESKGENKVRVSIYEANADGSPSNTLLSKPGQDNATDSTGNVKVSLVRPLAAGDRLAIVQAGEGFKSSALAKQNLEIEDTSTQGRLRSYFTAGILTSRDDNSFTGSSAYLALNLDETLASALAHRFGLHGFMEARLTSIPVSATSSTAPSGSGSGSTLDSFITSRKSGSFIFGAYAPRYLPHGLTCNAGVAGKAKPHSPCSQSVFFVAPLVKTGFLTPIDNQETTAKGVQSTPVNDSRFYHFGAAGIRFGRHSTTPDIRQAPELTHYLDVAVGKFSNLDTAVLDPSNNVVSSLRQWRWSLEGALKIPKSPLFVGFSANMTMFSPDQATLVRTYGSGVRAQLARDDLRFLFGTKFDAVKMYQALSKIPQH